MKEPKSEPEPVKELLKPKSTISAMEIPVLYETKEVKRPEIAELPAFSATQPEAKATPIIKELTIQEKLAKIALIEADLAAQGVDPNLDGLDDFEDDVFDLDAIDATVVKEEPEPEVDETPIVLTPLNTKRFGVQVYEAGSGPAVTKGSKVKAHYVGTFLSGVKFDSSRDRGSPFEFVVGEGNVIKCWDFAFPKLRVGDKATLNCPPFTAYGDRDRATIPAGSTLQFDVEVVGVEGGEEEEVDGFSSYSREDKVR